MAARAFVPTGSLSRPRYGHTATLLRSGEVLIAGGYSEMGDSPKAIAPAELYDPTREAFAETGSMVTRRHDHTATLLSDEEVLVAGGWGSFVDVLASAEVFNLTRASFAAASPMASPRIFHTATRLPDGKVLIVGGRTDKEVLASAELY
jgi:hypothetical protein